MIKAALLPESPLTIKLTIDLPSRSPLPRVAQRLDVGVTQKAHNHVDMIRHHYVVAEVVTNTVESVKAFRDYRAHFRLRENAFPHSLVQHPHVTTAEPFLKRISSIGRSRRDLRIGSMCPVSPEPFESF